MGAEVRFLHADSPTARLSDVQAALSFTLGPNSSICWFCRIKLRTKFECLCTGTPANSILYSDLEGKECCQIFKLRKMLNHSVIAVSVNLNTCILKFMTDRPKKMCIVVAVTLGSSHFKF